MVGYVVLNDQNSEELLEKNSAIETIDINEFNQLIDKDFLFDKDFLSVFNYLNGFISFYRIPEINLVVITSPVPAEQYGQMLHYLEVYLRAKKVVLDDQPQQQYLMGLKGQGATEGHIVTAYASADKPPKIQLFDSKVSDAGKFFSGEKNVRFGNLVASLFRSLRINPEQTIQLEIGELQKPDSPSTESKSLSVEANYFSLGTQSFFDPASCGYHSAATIKICQQLLLDREELNPEAILAAIGNPVSEGYETIQATNEYKVRIHFSDFLKQAWMDTIMPLDDEDQRKKLNFSHYFFGWPSENSKAQKALYLITLGFITNPLINMIRRPVEFAFNAASETANYFKNRLINWAPKDPVTQYFRSALLLLTFCLQGLFKGAYLVLRTVTSPITSFQAALTIKNPILRTLLSVASATTSLAAFAVLAYFVAPLAFAGLASVTGPVLATVAYPLSQLFSLIGLSLTPVAAALITAISAGVLFNATKGLANFLITKFNPGLVETPMVTISGDNSKGDWIDVSPALSALSSSENTPGERKPPEKVENYPSPLIAPTEKGKEKDEVEIKGFENTIFGCSAAK